MKRFEFWCGVADRVFVTAAVIAACLKAYEVEHSDPTACAVWVGVAWMAVLSTKKQAIVNITVSNNGAKS